MMRAWWRIFFTIPYALREDSFCSPVHAACHSFVIVEFVNYAIEQRLTEIICVISFLLTPQVLIRLNDNRLKNKREVWMISQIFFFLLTFLFSLWWVIYNIAFILGNIRGMSSTLDWHPSWVCSTQHGSSSKMAFWATRKQNIFLTTERFVSPPEGTPIAVGQRFLK